MYQLFSFAVSVSIFISAFVALPVPAHAAPLSDIQIKAVLGLLQSFGVNTSIIKNVEALLRGTAAAPAVKPYMTLTKPSLDAKGVVYQKGEWVIIEWKSQGVDKVVISLVDENNKAIKTTEEMRILPGETRNTYIFVIPKNANEKSKFKFHLVGSGGVNVWSNSFSII